MPVHAFELADSLGQVAVDQTKLTGVYDFRLRWSSDDLSGNPEPSAEPAPSIFTAVHDTLGLDLVHQRVDAPILVVDHADRTPREN